MLSEGAAPVGRTPSRARAKHHDREANSDEENEINFEEAQFLQNTQAAIGAAEEEKAAAKKVREHQKEENKEKYIIRDHSVDERFNFIETETFQNFINVVVAVNTVVLAGETDMPEFYMWAYFDNTFLLIYAAEFCMKIQHRGVAYFFLNPEGQVWNILDTINLALCVVDLWVTPLIALLTAGQGKSSSAIRMMRMLRLARLGRIVKSVKQLALFADALRAMLAPFLVMLSIVFGLNIFMAIIMTHILGHGEAMGDLALDPTYLKEIQPLFADIPTSFFTLYSVITADGWYGLSMPLTALNSLAWRTFFVLFIVFFSWTMLSILTAVASDQVIAVTSDHEEENRRLAQERHKKFVRTLEQMFRDADEDGNGLVDFEEFQVMVESGKVETLLNEFDIKMEKEKLYDTFRMLDVKDVGVITLEEFMEGLIVLGEGIHTRHVVGMDYDAGRIRKKMIEQLNQITGTAKKEKGKDLEVTPGQMHEVRRGLEDLYQKLQKQEQALRYQNLALACWAQWAGETTDLGLLPEALKTLGAGKGLERLTAVLRLYGMNFDVVWSALDVDNDGSVTSEEFIAWFKTIEPSLTQKQLEALWRHFDADGDGSVTKTEFISAVSALPEDDVTKHLMNLVRKSQMNFDVLWKSIDVDDDGSVTREEFRAWFSNLDPNLTQAQTSAVWKKFDHDLDGSITKEEFLLSLQNMVTEDVMARFMGVLRRNQMRSEAVWSTLDFDGDGSVTEQEFGSWFHALEPTLTQLQLNILWKKFDADGDLSVSKEEFLAVVEGLATEDVLLRFIAILKRRQMKSEGLWAALDADGDGAVTAEEFKTWFSGLQPNLSPSQLKSLWKLFDADGDGHVTKSEFLAAIPVILKEHGANRAAGTST